MALESIEIEAVEQVEAEAVVDWEYPFEEVSETTSLETVEPLTEEKPVDSEEPLYPELVLKV